MLTWGITIHQTRCDLIARKIQTFFFLSGMGTKIEYSINLLATLVDSNNLAVGGVDVWEHFQNKHQRTGINKLQGPMDRMLDRNNIQYIKKTMQRHEDIFKHQVSSTWGMIELFILTNTKIFMLLQMLHYLNSWALQIEGGDFYFCGPSFFIFGGRCTPFCV